MIESTPGVMGGLPCIAGTRITAVSMGKFRDKGYTPLCIRHEYPFLTIAQIRAAIQWCDDQDSRRQFDRDRWDP